MTEKDRQIKRLEQTVANYETALELLSRRNQELTTAEEGTFLHSPTYVQMCEKIEFMAAVEKLDKCEIARLKSKIPQAEEIVKKIYKENEEILKQMGSADSEYFVGITENWHTAWEYKKLNDEINRLNGNIEQLKFTMEQKEKEIERLQLLLGEQKVQNEIHDLSQENKPYDFVRRKVR